MSSQPLKRALLSVSDKSGLLELAQVLLKYKVELISSGGTGEFLKTHGLPFTPVETITGNPEVFGGRMKTISFAIGSSLLYRREHPQDLQEASELGIKPIDLVVCHLYPFEKIASLNGDEETLIENIDIGGPTMLRAAAKNFAHVAVCPDPSFYPELIQEIEQGAGHTQLEFRKKFSLATFRHCALYDALITRVLEERWETDDFSLMVSSAKGTSLRYGENPQQKAFCAPTSLSTSSLARSTPLQGKELSYNNLWDADSSWRALKDLHHSRQTDKYPSAVCIVKHANPCGLSLAATQAEALHLAWACDPVSSFGSIVSFNQEVTAEAAEILSQSFVELVLAPSFSKESLQIFQKKKNLRLMIGDLAQVKNEWTLRSIDGGVLLQTEDGTPLEELTWVSQKKSDISNALVRFGLVAVKHLRSNGIALVQESSKGLQLVGSGMGNPNRLVSISQAYEKAREIGISDFSDVALFSDAFFPFEDNILKAHDYGIQTFIQPGGSIKDNEVIMCVDRLNLKMATTQTRHFRH